MVKKELIPKIAKLSDGNLFIAFKLFESIHKEAILNNLEKIDNSIIESVINHFSNLKNVKLTNNKRIIIKYYLENKETFDNGFLTSTYIVKDLKFDNSNTWKYLTSLENKGVLVK